MSIIMEMAVPTCAGLAMTSSGTTRAPNAETKSAWPDGVESTALKVNLNNKKKH